MDEANFFDIVIGLLTGDDRAVLYTLMAVPASVSLFVGNWLGYRRGAVDVKQLKDENENLRQKTANLDERARLAEAATTGTQDNLDKARLLLGEKEQELSHRLGERDRAEARAADLDAKLAAIKFSIQGDVWGKEWTDPRAAGDDGTGGVERAFRRSRIPIISVANLKGGVGKTTVAANLGAYFAHQATLHPDEHRPILFIDLDFQGSLSATLHREAAGAGAQFDATAGEAGLYETLFDPSIPASIKVNLARNFSRAELGRSTYFDCAYGAAAFEEKELFEWVTDDVPKSDLRLRLAEFLYSQEVQERFGGVILDLPPRMTTFAVNAICASTDIVVPTKLDVMSAGAAPRFVAFLEKYRQRLWPHVSIAGIVGTMSLFNDMNAEETQLLEDAIERSNANWRGAQTSIANLGSIPARAGITRDAGVRFSYFNNTEGNPAPSVLFTNLGERVRQHLSRSI